jgi:hypothetical protein
VHNIFGLATKIAPINAGGTARLPLFKDKEWEDPTFTIEGIRELLCMVA